MGLKKMFETNDALEKEGVWNEFGDLFRVKIARAGVGNPAYSKEIMRVARVQQRAGTMSVDAERRVVEEVYAKTIVKGWQTKVDGKWIDGIDIDEGDLVPCNVENLKRLFAELPDLFNTIQKCADDAAAYRQHELEAIAKN